MIKRTYVYPAEMEVMTEAHEGDERRAPFIRKTFQSITEIPDRYDTEEKKYLLAGQALISAFKNEYNIWSCCKSGNTNEYLIRETERFKRIISLDIHALLPDSYWCETFFIRSFVNIDDKTIDECAGTNLVEWAENLGTLQSMEDLMDYVVQELTMKNRKNRFEENEVLVHGNIVNNHVLVWSRTNPLIETDDEDDYLPFD